MSEQPLDLKRSLRTAWRHKTIISIATAVGLLAGATFTAANPPSLASTALVVLPENTPDMSTQVVIASSDPVLAAASSSQRLGLTAEALRSKVDVKTPTSNIISITVKGGTAVQAEDMANAVANSYISFVTTRGNPGGTVQARMLQAASPGTGTPLPVYLLITAVLGALVGALVGIVIALGVGRKDRRLRTRDEIADAVGIPVLASVPVRQPGSPAAWMKLLDGYEPDVVHAWRLRQALYDLGVADVDLDNLGDGGGSTLSVISLSSDPGALAFGPQLAAFAASIGVPTVLEVGPQQNPNLATALRAACAAPPAGRSKRWEHLRLTAGDSDDADQHAGGHLTIVVVVVDAADPQVVRTRRTAVTSLSVSAGLVTAEQLASVAASTADDGRRLTGIFVANPEPTDHTTGRLPRLRRPRPRLMPTRLPRTMTETKR
jgi:capsular polysaccharide biosynthesis protein